MLFDSYQGAAREYDAAVDEYNLHCEVFDSELDELVAIRKHCQQTVVAVQTLVNSIARTPRVLAKEMRQLKSEAKKIDNSIGEYEKLRKRIKATGAAIGALAAGGAMFALSKKGRTLIQNVTKSKIPVIARVVIAVLLVIVFLIPFIVGRIGTGKLQKKLAKVIEEDQKVLLLIESCRQRKQELKVMESTVSELLIQLGHTANSKYTDLDRQTQNSLGSLVNAALALAEKMNEEL